MNTIHTLSQDDWLNWKALRLEALRESPAAIGSGCEDWKDAADSVWRQQLSNPDLFHVAAKRDGSWIGMVRGMVDHDGHTVELISMWVAPSARGTGAADQLVGHIEEWGRERTTELWLSVMPHNERAIALYSRLGFEHSDEVGAPLPDGSARELRMVKAFG
ncbi:MAG TPA: GNAT family N-acetyltransferase [Candidatus Corynebacterium avicola]|uniref:GNAT family N-acetyltransferase n=1 Tax=Candidatus Corynebacterium avicola TaxID=2838527 RepID=A0A9D1RRP8_9CORY|nr:GNAT family N-acetyltransferase [Candidatus Corynebacterium avicola]